MAPITRSSVHGRPSDHAQQVEPQNNGGLPEEPSEFDGEELEQEYEPDSTQEEPPQSHFQSSIQETLQSLQGTADRVTRQVEEFAKSLDRFNTARDHSDQTLWIDAWRLLERYSDIALNRRNQTSASSPSSLQDKRGRGDLEAQAENVQLEADLWILTKNLLVCHSPQTKFDAESNQDTRLGDLHRYTANTELWNAFLDSDIVGQEYECILDWLQERAAQSPTSIEEKLSDLAAKSERGDGVWSAGPMYTKSAIKKQKRARAWPLPLDPSNPALRHFHVRSSDQTPLVSQLDPDAQTREGSGLQDQDEYHEQAAWLTSWEMLRRGHHIGDIRSWWAERKEWWRAATICGCDPAAGQPQQSPWLRIMNLASNIQWLERCKLLCRGDVIGDEYQKAVYGLLCGDTAAPRTVCKSIDDHLFAIFNALLIERYQHYLHAYRHKLVDPSAIAYRPPPSSIGQVRQYVAYAQNDKSTKEESHQPHKFIEMALISGNFDAFFVQMGQAAAQVAHMTNQGAHLMEKDTTNPREPCAQLAAQNQDSVRIIAHLQVILRSLGFLEQAYRDHRYEMENNIANYIGSLQRDGKFILIPLYAAKLSEDRIPNVLGPILIEVTDPKERDSQVRLMKQYHINVSDVLYAIFYLANYNDIQRLRQAKLLFTAPRITEVGGTGKMQQIKVRSEFMSGELSDQEEIAVRSVEWYRYVDAENWGKACFSVSLLYKLFLAEGRLAAARDLYRSASLTDISLAAFSMNLRFADPATASDDFSDVGMDDDGAAAAAEEEEERVHPISPNPKRRERKKEHLLARPGTSRELLALKALVWAQLEELVIALEALEIWQDWVDDIDRNRSNTAQIRVMKQGLKKALDNVQSAMTPFFDPDFLCQANDQAEADMLTQIRNHYIPECILAYNGALYFAGHALSRVWLVECMNLAQLVAQNKTLTDAFVQSGRMPELVKAFALDGQALLHANEQGRTKSKKGKIENGNNEIWTVHWQDQGPIDLEALD